MSSTTAKVPTLLNTTFLTSGLSRGLFEFVTKVADARSKQVWYIENGFLLSPPPHARMTNECLYIKLCLLGRGPLCGRRTPLPHKETIKAWNFFSGCTDRYLLWTRIEKKRNWTWLIEFSFVYSIPHTLSISGSEKDERLYNSLNLLWYVGP